MLEQLKARTTHLLEQGKRILGEKFPLGKKFGRRKIIAVTAAAAVLLGGAGVFGLLNAGGRETLLDLNDTTVLSYTDMSSRISASGTVESAQSTLVYSTNSYTVKDVLVEVGDYVEEGQLMAELDDQNIQEQITSQELSIAASERTSSEQIKSAQDNYDNFKYGLDNGLNSSINSAQSQVDSALEAYETAQLTYDRYLESLELGENTTVLNAESSMRSARSSLEDAYDALESAQEAYDDAWDTYDETEADLDQAWDDLYDLEDEQDDIADEIDDLEDRIASSESGAAELERQLAAAEAELDRLNARKLELESILEENRTEEQKSELASLPGQIAQAQSEVTSLQQELSQAGNTADLQAELAALETELMPVEQELSAQDAEISQLESALEQAEAGIESAEDQVESASKGIEDAEANYESQLASYNASMTSVDNTLADYATNVESAWKTYQEALVSLESTQKSAQDQLESYENSLSSAYASANTDSALESLRQLRVDLEGTQIEAPCAGTVTAVYAEIGSSGSGLLFVIEDVNDLVVSTSIQGYDIGTVTTGMEVVISSDATGDQEIEGVVSRIAPTSNKTSQGTTDTSGDASFAAEVEITSEDSGLLIGMEAQLDYIVEEEFSVLAVPYEAVYENEAGQTCVLTAAEQEDGQYLIQEIPVSTGMDNDLDIAITGAEVKEGLRVINIPDDYLLLIGQTVSAAAGVL